MVFKSLYHNELNNNFITEIRLRFELYKNNDTEAVVPREDVNATSAVISVKSKLNGIFKLNE